MKLQLTICTLFFTLNCFSQLAEYKRIMDEKESKNLETFYEELKAFQKQNVQFSNVYFQIGEVELGLFSDLDPIVYRRAARQFIYNAKINYGLAKAYFDIKEAVKNPEWFNFEKIKDKDSLNLMIQAEVDNKYANTITYAEEYETLVENYDKAVSNYLMAREKFIEINTSYETLGDLFLRANDSLKQNVNEIGIRFDSCLYYLDIYREHYQKIPFSKKRQVNVIFKDIEQFRMNGISPSNFLADEIELWDYGSWSEQFSVLLKTEVDGLRTEIEQAYESFESHNKRMLYGKECYQINVDDLKLQRLINLISKYDPDSKLIDIFNYAKAKIYFGNLLVYERNCNELSGVPTDELSSRKARNVQNLFYRVYDADSVNTLLQSSSRNQNNFQWFYESYMQGDSGVDTFTKQQNEQTLDSFRKKVNELKVKPEVILTTDSIRFRFQVEDSLLVSDPVSITSDSLLIYYNRVVSNSLMIAYGWMNEAYYCFGITPDKNDYRVKWQYKLPSEAFYFKSLTDTSFVLMGKDRRTWLQHYYASGHLKVDFSPSSTASVSKLFYDELSSTYIMVEPTKVDSVIDYKRYDFNGKIEKDKDLTLGGRYLTHYLNDQNLWFFSIRETMNGSQIIADVFDLQLDPLERYTYDFEEEFAVTYLVKNDNETITIVADTFKENEIYYGLLDYEGNIKSSIKL